MDVAFAINNSIDLALMYNEIEGAPHFKDKTLVKRTDTTSQTQLSLDTLTTCQNNFNDTSHSVIQYPSSLIRCYSCQSFGHYANSCKSQSYCARCARQHYNKNCNRPPRCINCIRTSNKLQLKLNFHHPAFSKSCPTYKLITSKSLVQNDENVRN